MTNEELQAGFARFAQAQAAVLPSFADAAAALGNTARVAAQAEEYYAHAETSGISRERADEIVRERQGLRAGSSPTARELAKAREILRIEAGEAPDEDARQRRLFFADARDRGVSEQDAEKILTLAHSDDVRYGLRQAPYHFAYDALQVVTPSPPLAPGSAQG